ncbi:hypothetical protein [Neptuniibacter sp. QD37_11]|uniref:hypothetical protein n=1 Tax=Neptuniibacter sp. QD37_11 TaxID=3398209 RepID=UPI0039F5F960
MRFYLDLTELVHASKTDVGLLSSFRPTLADWIRERQSDDQVILDMGGTKSGVGKKRRYFELNIIRQLWLNDVRDWLSLAKQPGVILYNDADIPVDIDRFSSCLQTMVIEQNVHRILRRNSLN